MKVFRSLARSRGCFRRPIVTIGNFDGVHRGHQVILDLVCGDAKARGVDAVALTFDPHPVAILRPDKAPLRLMTLRDRLDALSRTGIDAVVVQRFSRAFADIEAESFVRGFLVDCLDVQKVVVGHDINYGRGRKGSTQTLIEDGARHGFAVEVIQPVSVGDIVVHSSNVRKAVGSGDVALAEKLLGRPHFVRGRCVHGAGVGKGLGFATANIAPATEAVPPDGVYATVAVVDGRRIEGVTSIGIRPTFDGTKRTIEAHLFDFDENLYGQVVAIEFLEHLRDQQKFDSKDELIAQVGTDIERAKQVHAARRGA